MAQNLTLEDLSEDFRSQFTPSFSSTPTGNLTLDDLSEDFRKQFMPATIDNNYQKSQGEELPPSPIEGMGDTAKGWKRGVEGLKGGYYGFLGLTGSLFDNESLKQYGYENFLKKMEEADKYKGVGLWDIRGVGSAIDWLQGAVGSIAPSVLESIFMGIAGGAIGSAVAPGVGTITGGATGFFGKQAVKTAIFQTAKRHVRNGIAKEKAIDMAMGEVKNFTAEQMRTYVKRTMGSIAAKAAIVGSVSPLEAGGNWGQNMTRSVDRPLVDLAFGTASGFLELLGGNIGVVDKVLGTPTAKALAKAIDTDDVLTAAKIGKRLLTQGAEEFGQEAGQELLSMIDSALVDPTFELFTMENLKGLAEAGMTGMVAGVGGGGVSTILDLRSGRKFLPSKITSAQEVEGATRRERFPFGTQRVENVEDVDELYKAVPELFAAATKLSSVVESIARENPETPFGQFLIFKERGIPEEDKKLTAKQMSELWLRDLFKTDKAFTDKLVWPSLRVAIVALNADMVAKGQEPYNYNDQAIFEKREEIKEKLVELSETERAKRPLSENTELEAKEKALVSAIDDKLTNEQQSRFIELTIKMGEDGALTKEETAEWSKLRNELRGAKQEGSLAQIKGVEEEDIVEDVVEDVVEGVEEAETPFKVITKSKKRTIQKRLEGEGGKQAVRVLSALDRNTLVEEAKELSDGGDFSDETTWTNEALATLIVGELGAEKAESFALDNELDLEVYEREGVRDEEEGVIVSRLFERNAGIIQQRIDTQDPKVFQSTSDNFMAYLTNLVNAWIHDINPDNNFSLFRAKQSIEKMREDYQASGISEEDNEALDGWQDYCREAIELIDSAPTLRDMIREEKRNANPLVDEVSDRDYGYGYMQYSSTPTFLFDSVIRQCFGKLYKGVNADGDIVISIKDRPLTIRRLDVIDRDTIRVHLNYHGPTPKGETIGIQYKGTVLLSRKSTGWTLTHETIHALEEFDIITPQMVKNICAVLDVEIKEGRWKTRDGSVHWNDAAWAREEWTSFLTQTLMRREADRRAMSSLERAWQDVIEFLQGLLNYGKFFSESKKFNKLVRAIEKKGVVEGVIKVSNQEAAFKDAPITVPSWMRALSGAISNVSNNIFKRVDKEEKFVVKEPGTRQQIAVAEAGKPFGVTTLFHVSEGNSITDRLNGIFFKDSPFDVSVSTTADTPLQTIGHLLYHSLGIRYPGIWKSLKVLSGNIPGYVNNIKAVTGVTLKNPDYITEKFYADLVGDLFLDKQFREILRTELSKDNAAFAHILDQSLIDAQRGESTPLALQFVHANNQLAVKQNVAKALAEVRSKIVEQSDLGYRPLKAAANELPAFTTIVQRKALPIQAEPHYLYIGQKSLEVKSGYKQQTPLQMDLQAKLEAAKQASKKYVGKYTKEQYEEATPQRRREMKAEVWAERGMYLKRKFGWFVGIDRKWRYALSDKDAKYQEEAFEETELNAKVGLKEIFKHSLLEQLNVPWKDINVKKKPFTGESTGGVVSPLNLMFLYDLPIAQRKVILHELQHYIQDMEEFAVGTSLTDPTYRRQAGEIEAKEVDRQRDLSQAELLEDETAILNAQQKLSAFYTFNKKASPFAAMEAPTFLIPSVEAESNNKFEDKLGFPRRGPAYMQAYSSTEETSTDEVKQVFDTADKLQEKSLKELGKAGRFAFEKAFLDITLPMKRLLKENVGAYKSKDVKAAIIAAKGYSIQATHFLEEAMNAVYKGLTVDQKNIVNRIIYLARSLEICRANLWTGDREMTVTQMREHLVHLEERYNISTAQANDFCRRAGVYFDRMFSLLEMMRTEGLISREEFDLLKKFDWTSTKALAILDPVVDISLGSLSVFKKNISGNVRDSGIEELTPKSDEKSLPNTNMQWILTDWAQRVHKRIFLNRVGKELWDIAGETGDEYLVRGEKLGLTPMETVKVKKPSGYGAITFMEGGKRKKVYAPKDFVSNYQIDMLSMPRWTNLVRVASGSSVLRPMATGIRLGFIPTNMAMDLVLIWNSAKVINKDGKMEPVYSRFAPITAAQMGLDLVRNFKDALFRQGEYLKYGEVGGLHNFLAIQGRPFERQDLVRKFGSNFGGKYTELKEHGSWIMDKLSYLNETSEIVTRLAVLDRAITKIAAREGLKEEQVRNDKKLYREAAMVAKDYLDFAQHGVAIKAADQIMPYLNSFVQVQRSFVRGAVSDPTTTSLIILQFFVLGILEEAARRFMFGDDDEDKDKPKSDDYSPHDRALNLIIHPFGKAATYTDAWGQKHYPYLKIPLQPHLAIAKVCGVYLGQALAGEEVNGELIRQARSETLGLSRFDPTKSVPTLKAWLTYAYNIDSFLGGRTWAYSDYVSAAERKDPKNRAPFFEDIVDLLNQYSGSNIKPEQFTAAMKSIGTTGNYLTYLFGAAYNYMSDQPDSYRNATFYEIMKDLPTTRGLVGVTKPGIGHYDKVREWQEEATTESFVAQASIHKTGLKYREILGGKMRGDVRQAEADMHKEAMKIINANPDLMEEVLNVASYYREAPQSKYFDTFSNLAGKSAVVRAKTFKKMLEKAGSESKREALWSELAMFPSLATKDFHEEFAKLY